MYNRFLTDVVIKPFLLCTSQSCLKAYYVFENVIKDGYLSIHIYRHRLIFRRYNQPALFEVERLRQSWCIELSNKHPRQLFLPIWYDLVMDSKYL